ncbi:PAC2 family protein, partial [Nonomuraea sp. NPDC049141]
MLDPHELYELTDDLPDLGQPVLIQTLTGFVDAGSATRLAREQLLTSLDARPIARFDVDQLFDYRSRRPVMTFVEDHWESYDAPALELHLLRDDDETPFLLLTGPEPDLQWERFVAAIAGISARLDVRLTVGLNSIPMAVPHTRPAGVTAHATRRELIAGYEPWLQRVQVPGSVGHLLEYRLGELGRDALGFAAHVPHYVAQTEYPAAA